MRTGNLIEVNINGNMKKNEACDIYTARENAAQISTLAREIISEVTIIILAYNHLEKTRRCVESVLKYTQDVDYDLILIDNGSDADMLEYFKSIDYPKTTILHLNKNLEAGFPYQVISMHMLSEYVVTLSNDIIVTKNWLSNMLKVFAADEKVGAVNPVGCNMSNLQQIQLNYSSYEEMQEQAALFNVSNPAKWQERLRIITLGIVFKKACLYAIGWPLADVGYLHDFVDDDIAFRVRRMGYKVVLAGDTWICHDHKIEEKDPVALQKSLERGRADFQQKYHGIDAWDDVNNYIFHRLGNSIKQVGTDHPKILGIDVKCGTPILDIKNTIRKFGIYDAECSAFTRDEKYVADLNTICNGIVACGTEETLTRKLIYDYYDYIIIDRPLNAYHEPMSVLMDAFMLLKQGGQLLFSLKNTNSILTLLGILGTRVITKDEYCYNYTIDALVSDLNDMNISFKIIGNEPLNISNNQLTEQAQKVLETNCDAHVLREMSARLMADRYWISIEK